MPDCRTCFSAVLCILWFIDDCVHLCVHPCLGGEITTIVTVLCVLVVLLVAARKAASVELRACLSIPTILINLYVWRGVEQRCAAGYLRIYVCCGTIHIYIYTWYRPIMLSSIAHAWAPFFTLATATVTCQKIQGTWRYTVCDAACCCRCHLLR
jgi:hypothetical protein